MKHLIERGLVNGSMKWKVIDGNSREMICFSETYEGAVKASKEIRQPFDDPLIKIRESEINYELLDQVIVEKARIARRNFLL